MSEQKISVTLYVEAGPTNTEMIRNAQKNIASEFIIVSRESGMHDHMCIHLPLEVVKWEELIISGDYKKKGWKYRMKYYPASGTGIVTISLKEKEDT